MSRAWVFADGDFNSNNWILDYDSTRGAAFAWYYSQIGNPAPSVYIELAVNTAQELPLEGNFYRPDFSYDPSSQGALTTLYFAQDGYGGGRYVETDNQFLIIQNGIKYMASATHGSYQGRGGMPEWVTFTATTQASDFASAGGQHPDWSSTGSPLTFGVTRSLVRNTYSNDVTNGLDNFWVGTMPVPEPASLTVLGLGMAFLLRQTVRRH
ncbi:MAG TPA: PEP-CTERM sorting domain-containing protein [Fimbriimonadaceae bacterium]|nr:PEP-CTERM sorting domain-containing protein [Fimbriimonadaceae bacterium]